MVTTDSVATEEGSMTRSDAIRKKLDDAGIRYVRERYSTRPFTNITPRCGNKFTIYEHGDDTFSVNGLDCHQALTVAVMLA